MNRHQKIIISVTGIILVLLILVGLTYAYFLTRINGNPNDTSLTVTTANLELTYTDGNGILTPANTLIPDTDVTFLDGNGNIQTQKTFTVTNNGNDTEYVVFIDNINVTYAKTKGTQVAGESTTFESNDFRYTLTCTITSSDSSRNNTSCDGVTNGVFPLTNDSVLVGNDILKGDVHNYTLTMKYIESYKNQTNDKNKTLSAQINIEDISRLDNPYSDNKDSLAYNIINNAINKTNGTELMATPPTTPAEKVSGENERILSTTQDDHGTSYYYRGNVIDNYVTFADMCWKIVRIEGDGSTKLILEDQDQPCSTSINGNWDIPTTSGGSTKIGNFGYTLYSEFTLTASDGTQNSKGTYIMDYLHGQTNNDKSMATAFKNFQNTFTETELSKLKSGNWCLGDTGYSRNGLSYTSLNETQMWDSKVKASEIYYDSYVRLTRENEDGYQSKLKCNGIIMNDWEDDETNPTPMYVGAITADELAHAGLIFSSHYSSNCYLDNNTTNNDFWTLSPYNYNLSSAADQVIRSTFGGDGLGYLGVAGSIAFRPTVSLASSAVITSGEGTLERPYVIG